MFLKSRLWNIFLLLVIGLIAGGAVWRFWILAQRTGLDYALEVAGDTARNTSGIFAVAAAGTAAWIAFQTNKARSLEASRAQFKDRLQWAVEHSKASNDLEGLLAEKLIESAASNENISKQDLEIAQAIAMRQIELRERAEYHAQQYEKHVRESLETIWNDFKDVQILPEDKARLLELQKEFRLLKLALSNYNKDVQYMLMADNMREILDIYRRAAGGEET